MHRVMVVVVVVGIAVLVVVGVVLLLRLIVIVIVIGAEALVLAAEEIAFPDATGKTGETNVEDASKCPETVVVRANAGLYGRAGGVDAQDRGRGRDGVVVRAGQKRTKATRTTNPSPSPQKQTMTVLPSNLPRKYRVSSEP